MRSAKIAITLDPLLLARLDKLVEESRYPNRSQAIQEAIRDKLDRLKRGRLARACALVNREEEQKMADEGLAEDMKEWPEY